MLPFSWIILFYWSFSPIDCKQRSYHNFFLQKPLTNILHPYSTFFLLLLHLDPSTPPNSAEKSWENERPFTRLLWLYFCLSFRGKLGSGSRLRVRRTRRHPTSSVSFPGIQGLLLPPLPLWVFQGLLFFPAKEYSFYYNKLLIDLVMYIYNI